MLDTSDPCTQFCIRIMFLDPELAIINNIISCIGRASIHYMYYNNYNHDTKDISMGW